MNRKHNVKSVIDKQTGRSMLEMLGVVAIIGVLSIGGIVGYQYAMQIYRENQTINAFSVTVAGARTAELMESFYYSCEQFPCKIDPKYVVSGVDDLRVEDFSTAVGAPVRVQIENEKGYTVRIQGLSPILCEQIKQGRWAESCAGIVSADKTINSCADLDNLVDIDCNELPQADTGLIRRSALQQDVDEGGGWVEFGSAKYPSLVLYYENRVVESKPSRAPIYKPSTESDESDMEQCSDVNSQGCCLQANGIWRNGMCCTGNGEKFDALGTKIKECWCAGNGDSVFNVNSRKRANAFCCEANGLTWKNGECCNGKLRYDLQPSDNCYQEPDEFCPAPHELEGAVCCEVSDSKRTGKNVKTNDDDPVCVAKPDDVCSVYTCDTGAVVERDGVCCCGEINLANNTADTRCYTPTCTDQGGVCAGTDCETCCHKTEKGLNFDGNPDPLCCANSGGVCGDLISDPDCDICCNNSTGTLIDGTPESLCCTNSGGECAGSGCEICCAKDETGKTGFTMTGESNDLCVPTCADQNGECAGTNCEVCCQPGKTGKTIDDEDNDLCEPTCADKGGVCLDDDCTVCCDLQKGASIDGDGAQDQLCCANSNGECAGTDCEFCCESPKTGYMVNHQAEDMCKPTCAEQNGECAGTDCEVCCEKDETGKTGLTIDGKTEPLCEPTCAEKGGVCSDDDCTVCCANDNSGEILDGNGEIDSVCCVNAGGECSDSSCTVCCNPNNSGYTMKGGDPEPMCNSNAIDCEEKGGVCSDDECTVCCANDNSGKTIDGNVVAACCNEVKGQCAGQDCAVCCDPNNEGYTMENDTSTECASFYCDSSCVLGRDNFTCCNSEDTVFNANGSISDATLCNTSDQQHSECCEVFFGGLEYYVRDSF